MTLNKTAKTAVGIGTLWILIYPVLFIGFMFLIPFSMMEFDRFGSASPFDSFGLIFPLHCLTGIIMLGLIGFYLTHIIKNTGASETARIILGIGIFFMPYIAMPFYFYLYIWRPEPPEWARATQKAATTTDPDFDDPAVLIQQLKEEDPSPTTKKSNNRQLLIVLGVIGAVVILAIAGFGIFAYRAMNDFMQDIEDTFAEPEPILYDSLPTYAGNEKPYFHPADLGDFTEIIHFKEISTWLYANEVPILIADNALFLAGTIQPDDGWGDINVDLFRVNIETGKVDWQARAGSARMFTDGRYLFTEAVNNFGAAGMVAFDIKTGEQLWETRFDYDYAAGIGNAILNDSSITVETYHHGNSAVFVVDTESGRIISQEKNVVRTGRDISVPYNDLVLEKDGTYPGNIIAFGKDNYNVVWQSEETAVGNFAVSGPVTYFLTDAVQLLAVDTNTGSEIGKLILEPRFSPDFDFVNSSIIVAADENVVALYFEETQQLSIYKLNQAESQ